MPDGERKQAKYNWGSSIEALQMEVSQGGLSDLHCFLRWLMALALHSTGVSSGSAVKALGYWSEGKALNLLTGWNPSIYPLSIPLIHEESQGSWSQSQVYTPGRSSIYHNLTERRTSIHTYRQFSVARWPYQQAFKRKPMCEENNFACTVRYMTNKGFFLSF